MTARAWPLLGAAAAFAFLPVAFMLLFVLLGQSQQCSAAPAPSTPPAASGPATVIGDSLPQGAETALTSRLKGAKIDAVPGQPWRWGLGEMRAQHPTGLVAFLLDTNMGASAGDVDELLHTYPSNTFVLMTVSVPFSYESTTNAAILAAARANPTRVFVADWHAAVTADPRLVGPDHVHPNTPAGWQAFADVVAAAVGKATPQQTSAPSTATSVKLAANVKPAGDSYGPPPWSQQQMEAAVARYDPTQAHVLGAIAMAETAGYQFPTVNPTGTYHGPWAFQVASNAPRGVDMGRLDRDLDYAAQQAAQLASTGITHGKWETWPTMAQKYLRGPASGVAGATLTGAQAPQPACANASAFVAGGGVASDGHWVFPLRTSQAALRRGSQTASGQFETWCYTDLSNCHHDYNAADIMAPTGTPVLMPVSGTIVNTHRAPSNGCMGLDNRGDTVSFRGDDGKAYFMGHMLMGSLTVHIGEHVPAGAQIGVVGTIGNAQCTVPHLHVQQNPPGDYGGQSASFNVQPVLVSLFSKLPK